jgi:hypothetical protein
MGKFFWPYLKKKKKKLGLKLKKKKKKKLALLKFFLGLIKKYFGPY